MVDSEFQGSNEPFFGKKNFYNNVLARASTYISLKLFNADDIVVRFYGLELFCGFYSNSP